MESLSVVSGSPTRFRTREARWRRFRRRAHLVFRGTHMRDRAPMQKSKDWKGEEEERARDRRGEEAETGRASAESGKKYDRYNLNSNEWPGKRRVHRDVR